MLGGLTMCELLVNDDEQNDMDGNLCDERNEMMTNYHTIENRVQNEMMNGHKIEK